MASHMLTDFGAAEPACPEMDDFVRRLVARLPRASATDGQLAELVTEVLTFAAATHQRLADQQVRIAELEALALTDPLTGIANRRGFLARLDQTIGMARRHGQTALLGLLDVNDFKTINDRFGHPAGDEALRRIAGQLRDGLRREDCVARIGGDEFAVILVHCDPGRSRERLASLQSEIMACPMPLGDGERRVQISLGSAAITPDADAAAILAEADRALYAQKPGPTRQAPPAAGVAPD